MVVAAVLGASALALDAWVLSGLPVPRVSPRVQWAVAPTWIIVSFCCLAVGTVPLVAALEGWLGPLRSTPRGQVPQYEQAALMVFAALAAAHISGLFFAPTAQRRHLCFLGVAITGCAFLAYSSLLLTTAVIPSTYGGRAFEPLRYVLWAHTTPAMALIVAAASPPPWHPSSPKGASGTALAGEPMPLLPLVRMIGAGCMGCGFMATARVPALPLLSLRAYPAVAAAYTYAWRAAWLALSFTSMCLALRRLCTLVQLNRTAPAFRRNLICGVVVATWCSFPA